jgi:hypothetical protein
MEGKAIFDRINGMDMIMKEFFYPVDHAWWTELGNMQPSRCGLGPHPRES